MKPRPGLLARFLSILLVTVLVGSQAWAAPYAAMVMDMRTGEIIHSRNADTQLHPASLTKMMTLYIAFEAITHGEIDIDKKVTISAKAANEPPSKLGLRKGQKIALRYLIRAAAVKSANDAATAIAEAISGSEAAFARRMNRTAQAMGLSRTQFKNAHGLTEAGHMSTARDMTVLGRHLFFDYPDYYNLFSRRSANVGGRKVPNTNTRFLEAYRGADGIKTGYTRAAGYNLVASAERGSERIIATVFGGKSTASRNAKVAELLDLGFRRAPTRAAVRMPRKPAYQGTGQIVVASNGDRPTAAGRTIRISGAPLKSIRPTPRPGPVISDEVLIAAIENDIRSTVTAPVPPAEPRPVGIILTSTEVEDTAMPVEQEIITRLSTSGGRHWGINVGLFGSANAAERMLLKTALAELSTLGEALRKVVKHPRGYDANFVGLTADGANLACRRLQARNVSCKVIGPS